MAIIFMGTPDFAVPALKALIEEGEDVVLVVTQPDKVRGRGHVLSSPPVKNLALSLGIKVSQPEKIRDPNFYSELASYNPEFIIVVAYGRILPKEILNLPEKGCVNAHGSLLPKYRGAAPIQWAVLNGDKTTGVTTMLMDEGMDTGDILMQASIEIYDDDTAGSLFERLAMLAAEVLIQTIKGIRDGSIRPTPQTGEPTFAPPLKKEDGLIDWSRRAVDLVNFVRGMNPWPCAFTRHDDLNIKILKARAIEGKGEPGRIERASNGLLAVGTGDGLLVVEELQPEGKRVMNAAAFLAGRRFKEGYEKFY